MHHKNRSQEIILSEKREQAEPQIYTVIVIKTRIDITQKYSHEMLQINEKAPASSPILTVKTAGLALAHRTFLKVQLHKNDPQYLSLLLLKRPKECPIIKCYSNRCAQNAECRLHTGGVGLSFLDSTRPTNISALMMRIKRNFPMSY